MNYEAVISAIRTSLPGHLYPKIVVIRKSMLSDPTEKCASSFDLNEDLNNIVASVDKLSLLFINYLDSPYNIRKQTHYYPRLYALNASLPCLRVQKTSEI